MAKNCSNSASPAVHYDHMTVYNILEEPVFSIHGLYRPREEQRFIRMPEQAAMGVDNECIRTLYTNTAGGRIRFATDSDHIILRAVMKPSAGSPHMPDTARRCFDLYLDGHYHNVFRPGISITGNYADTGNLPDGYECGYCFEGSKMREVLIHFPLYDNVEQVYIALKEGARLLPPREYKIQKPIVYYGSSITQGGCASHAGNSYQAIISRELDADYLNLGFSGGCRAELPMADYFAGLEMSAFVYDYDHNAVVPEFLAETHEKFFRALRAKRPELPILMVSAADNCFGDKKALRRDIIRRTWENARAAGDRNVYFLDGGEIYKEVGVDLCTVDNTHPNDLGFYLMAKAIGKELKAILK